MELHRVTRIDDPRFADLYALLQRVFPPEEVLAFDEWAEPLADEGLRVVVAVEDGQVVGATEYRYYPDLEVGMIDFTIITEPGRSVGRLLWRHRLRDMEAWAAESGRRLIGLFAEVYDPQRISQHDFGGLTVMHPVVRREVLSHLGFRRLDFLYVHPSWQNDGEAVGNLDLCFWPSDEDQSVIDASLVASFLERYYTVLPNKPQSWHRMVADLRALGTVALAGL
ncbi:GNAT family N-acetyltransferase [Alicyclobacillus macrosporangiidus]|uniref:GNAT family N-acetyltransferase n=1 Tax=Alicyclobacillus macrosporangiidus TaxID=392015 RepID=UPI00049611FB|nr:GNAT family N-acetyltransferase [Alicyclobacillus macrosporangiidus]